jgi:hypothetical protein
MVDDLLSMTIQIDIQHLLGEPTIAGPLALWPVFGPAPHLSYRSLGQATGHGAFVAEVADGAEVNQVRVCNASDAALLLYEGELILGAQQNRTIDQPVLVAAGADLAVPVSCVEQGRWDDAFHAEHFTPSKHSVHPALRHAKRATSNARAAAGAPARPDQGEVWAGVADELDAHAVASPTHTFSDVFAAQRDELDRLVGRVAACDGQVGVVVQLGGQPIALDLVSRADVFADLLPRLAQGYALQALRALRAGTVSGEPSPGRADAFFELVLGRGGDERRQPTPGLGEAFVPARAGIEGCGLRVDGELVALSAFPVGA